MTYALTWLADTLRAAGLTVIESPHWQECGRGEMGVVKGVLLHHTAGPRTGNAPSLNTVLNGRPDLPGPLSQLFLARDGTFHVLAAGRCNHAGAGSWQGVTTGNSSFIGIEAENAGDGTDPWPANQMDAYIVGVAAILKRLDVGSQWAAGHKEYAMPRGRKIDPSFEMGAFRAKVATIMDGGAFRSSNMTPSHPSHAMLKMGDSGTDVMLLQSLLGFPAKDRDGDFGPATNAAVLAFQRDHGLFADGFVGPKTWAAFS